MTKESPLLADPTMKRCSGCGITKLLDDFHRQRRARDGRESRCKACEHDRYRVRYERDPGRWQARNKRWVQANPERVAERQKRWNQTNPERRKEIEKRSRERLAPDARERRAKRREALDAYKRAQGCADCGTTEGKLHFDHRPGTEKRFGIAVATAYSWDSLWTEIAKCDVRCASCHSKRHWAIRKAAA
jgi:hypothetical protein